MNARELSLDPRFATADARRANSRECRELVGAWTEAHTTADVTQRLGAAIPVGAVQSIAEIFADPHVAARDMLVSVEQPGSAEPVMVAGVPIKLARALPAECAGGRRCSANTPTTCWPEVANDPQTPTPIRALHPRLEREDDHQGRGEFGRPRVPRPRGLGRGVTQAGGARHHRERAHRARLGQEDPCGADQRPRHRVGAGRPDGGGQRSGRAPRRRDRAQGDAAPATSDWSMQR